jgi:hypothetical protein
VDCKDSQLHTVASWPVPANPTLKNIALGLSFAQTCKDCVMKNAIFTKNGKIPLKGTVSCGSCQRGDKSWNNNPNPKGPIAWDPTKNINNSNGTLSVTNMMSGPMGCPGNLCICSSDDECFWISKNVKGAKYKPCTKLGISGFGSSCGGIAGNKA